MKRIKTIDSLLNIIGVLCMFLILTSAFGFLVGRYGKPLELMNLVFFLLVLASIIIGIKIKNKK